MWKQYKIEHFLDDIKTALEIQVPFSSISIKYQY